MIKIILFNFPLRLSLLPSVSRSLIKIRSGGS